MPALAATRTLMLWGRCDEVIPAAAFPNYPAAKLAGALPSAEFRWIESSGHTPHLEQPAVTAAALVAFVRGETPAGDDDVSQVVAEAARWEETRQRAAALAERAKAAVEKVAGAVGAAGDEVRKG